MTASTEALINSLKLLKLHGMASATQELGNQASPAFDQSKEVLRHLIKAEVADRDVRTVNYQMKVAKFPAYRDLAGYDFNHGSVDETLVRQLHRC